MSLPSAALRALVTATKKNVPRNKPLTWGELHDLVQEAAKAQEDFEHDEYMGDDQ